MATVIDSSTPTGPVAPVAPIPSSAPAQEQLKQLVHHQPPAISSNVDWAPPPSPTEGGYKLYTDTEGRWVVYEWEPARKHPGIRIEPFYKRWPPSQTSAETCAWICVNRGRGPPSSSPAARKAVFNDATTTTTAATADSWRVRRVVEPTGRDLDGLRCEFRELVSGLTPGNKVAPEQMDVLAKKYNIVTGKWLIYCKSWQIDQLWRRVVGMVCFHRRRGQVKVSTREEGDDSHVICVYVDDYTDRKDVDELRKALREHAKVVWKIGFKPDAYTYLGIYKNNELGLRPSRYHDSDNYAGRN